MATLTTELIDLHNAANEVRMTLRSREAAKIELNHDTKRVLWLVEELQTLIEDAFVSKEHITNGNK